MGRGWKGSGSFFSQALQAACQAELLLTLVNDCLGRAVSALRMGK